MRIGGHVIRGQWRIQPVTLEALVATHPSEHAATGAGAQWYSARGAGRSDQHLNDNGDRASVVEAAVLVARPREGSAEQAPGLVAAGTAGSKSWGAQLGLAPLAVGGPQFFRGVLHISAGGVADSFLSTRYVRESTCLSVCLPACLPACLGLGGGRGSICFLC